MKSIITGMFIPGIEPPKSCWECPIKSFDNDGFPYCPISLRGIGNHGRPEGCGILPAVTLEASITVPKLQEELSSIDFAACAEGDVKRELAHAAAYYASIKRIDGYQAFYGPVTQYTGSIILVCGNLPEGGGEC